MNQPKKTKPKLIRDRVFKKYFKDSAETVTTLLNQFLPLPKGRRIQSIEFLDPIMQSDKLKDKESILDLRIRLDNGSLVNIEMQSASENPFKERILYYLAKLFTSSLKEGEKYQRLCKAYSLVFTDFTVFKELKNYYSIFSLREDQNPGVIFSPYLRIILVELTKFKKVDLKSLNKRESWCYIMNNSDTLTREDCEVISGKGGDMKQAVKRWQKMSEEESLQIIAEAEEKQRKDRVSQLAYARDKGIEEGLQKVILNMLKKKADLKFISEVTGMSVKEIKKLKNGS